MKRMIPVLAVVLSIATLVAVAHGPQDKSTANFDISFMNKMVMHHEMGKPMLEMCTTKAVHEELKQFCSKSMSDQQRESSMMKSWLGESSTANASMNHAAMQHDPDQSKKKMGDMDHAGMSKPQMDQMKQAEQTMEQSSGADFEQRFLTAMPKHHQMAIQMAKPCPAKAQKAELRDLCKEIVTKQTDERRQLLDWKQQWYGGKAKGASK